MRRLYCKEKNYIFGGNSLSITALLLFEIKPIDESKGLIREWEADGNIENFITSATIEAVKP